MEELSKPQPVEKQMAHPKFMPVGELLRASWNLLTRKLLKIILLGIYSFLATVVLFVLCGVLLLLSLSGMVPTLNDPNAIMVAIGSIGFLTNAAVALLVLLIALTAINLAVQAAMILIVSSVGETASTMDRLKKGFAFVLPLLVVTSIQTFFTLGSAFLFLIPSLIVSFFLSFTVYVVVLEEKRGFEALKMSVGIVQQHFGAIFARFFLFFLIMVGSYVVFGMISSISDSIAAQVGLVQAVFNMVIGWLAIPYSYLVYEQARAQYDVKKPVSFAWVWIVSILGWIIGALAIVGMINLAKTIDPDSLKNLIERSIEENKSIDPNEIPAPGMKDVNEFEQYEQFFDEDTMQELRQIEKMQRDVEKQI